MRTLTVYLLDGTRETFTLARSAGYACSRYEYRLDDAVLTVVQADTVHYFPLSTIRKWETS